MSKVENVHVGASVVPAGTCFTAMRWPNYVSATSENRIKRPFRRCFQNYSSFLKTQLYMFLITFENDFTVWVKKSLLDQLREHEWCTVNYCHWNKARIMGNHSNERKFTQIINLPFLLKIQIWVKKRPAPQGFDQNFVVTVLLSLNFFNIYFIVASFPPQVEIQY